MTHSDARSTMNRSWVKPRRQFADVALTQMAVEAAAYTPRMYGIQTITTTFETPRGPATPAPFRRAKYLGAFAMIETYFCHMKR